MTVIKYIIPEDGDDQSHPNVFMVSSAQPTLLEIKKSFPLPGDYHFRFLKVFGDLQVWMDILDESIAVPLHSGSIFAKISRRSKVNFEKPVTIASADPVKSSPAGPQPSRFPEPIQPPARPKSEKLLKFDDMEALSPSPVVASTFGDSGDLLGFNSPSPTSTTAPQSSSGIDLFGLDSLQPMNAQPMTSPAMGIMSGSTFPTASGGVMSRGGSSGGLAQQSKQGSGFDAFNSLSAGSFPPPQPQPSFGQFPPRGVGNPSMQTQRRPF